MKRSSGAAFAAAGLVALAAILFFALRGFASAKRGETESARAHLDLGATLASSGQAVKAAGEFRRAAEIEPANPEAHRELACALVRMGDAAGLIDELERWVALRPDDAEAWSKLARVRIDPATPQDRRDPLAALSAATRAAELSKEPSPEILDALAAALFANDNAVAAVDTEEKALALAKRAPKPDAALVESLGRNLERFRAAAPRTRR